MTYEFLNYCTIYSSTGDVDIDMGKDCCFHEVTIDQAEKKMHNTYEIILIKNESYLEEDENNYCFLSENEIKYVLENVKNIYSFEYSIEEIEYSENIPAYKIKIEISGFLIFHKFILKMIRSFYEFPFNFIMKDILNFIKYEPFCNYNIVTLYAAFTSFLYNSDMSINDDQSICGLKWRYNPILPNTSKRWLKTLYSSLPKMNIIEMYDYESFDNLIVNNDKIKVLDDNDYEFWFSVKQEKERFEYYSENLKLIKIINN